MLRPAICGLLSLFVLAMACQAEEPKPPLELKIAVPIHHQHRSLYTGQQFHVLVKNVSDAPLRLWTDRYSWGYENLSFEVIAEDGRVTSVKKRPREWSKNIPDWLQLQPGDSYVLTVNFSAADIWENPPEALAGKKPSLFKMRAVYEIKPDDQSTKHAVWTGKLESAVDTYAIW